MRISWTTLARSSGVLGPPGGQIGTHVDYESPQGGNKRPWNDDDNPDRIVLADFTLFGRAGDRLTNVQAGCGRNTPLGIAEQSFATGTEQLSLAIPASSE